MDGNDARPACPEERLALRCYAPSTSAIVAFVLIGYLALREVTGHALAAVGLVTTIMIALGVAGVTAGAITVAAATIRQRRAAAGACHTCSHPCRQQAELDAPRWPHRPLTRTTLPIVDIPRQQAAAPGTDGNSPRASPTGRIRHQSRLRCHFGEDFFFGEDISSNRYKKSSL